VEPLTVEGIVLRSTPYGESSLVAALLTAEDGQQHFMVKGGRRSSRRQFPAVDFLRRVQVVYRPSRGELHTARDVTCLEAFDALAQRPRAFRGAGWLARLLLANTVQDAPAPQLYRALHLGLQRLCAGVLPMAVLVGCTLVLLAEHGVLPEAESERAAAGLAQTLAWATDPRAPQPPYDDATWQRVFDWLLRFGRRAQLSIPDGARL